MKNTPIIELNYSLSKKTLTYRLFSYPRFFEKGIGYDRQKETPEDCGS